ncbi:DoxX family protein [Blastococcus sp. VKM Ac-2987]|uniref:DoxX family protein n=1 Tax=Blastococcus sp. VKM Ac-2987 TaxID=3004141 RepID=UPI0022ABA2D7|nr:DoxX family protein [Blastococcus sp. VKM Ac-2987]MCZ2860654.1 DoxX family protein [Blastococcus sp. VKM Ac-2987]
MPPTQNLSALQDRPWSPMPPDEQPAGLRSRVDSLLMGLTTACERYGHIALRLSLALVFVWFGALKLTGDTPVEGLIAATLPFVSPDVAVPVLGLVEIAIGLAVAAGIAPRVVLLVLAGHLTGTFLSFVTATGLMVTDGNPLLLTADGEFVLKNLVLISAALVLVGRELRGPRPAARDAAVA